MKPFAFSFAMPASGSALAAEPYHVENIMLLQHDFVLQERVRVDELAHYIQAVNAAAKANLQNVTAPMPSSGFVVMAVRPGGRSKAWLDFTPPLAPATDAGLRSAVERVTPFQAKEGVVVFAIRATLWSAAPTQQQGPFPVEWKQVLDSPGAPIEIGDLVERVWPAGAGD